MPWRRGEQVTGVISFQCMDNPTIPRALPDSVHLRYWRWPEDDEGEIVEFRLIYKGPLSSHRGGGRGGTVVKQKHSIRKQFHRQLRELWRDNHWLKQFMSDANLAQPGESPNLVPVVECMANNYKRCGFKFLPLVSKQWGIACALDILLLRRDDPGNLLIQGGDIDNRVKTLFDALSIPIYENQVEGFSPDPDETPFYCLLEDDRLVTEVKVTADRLWVPIEKEENPEDVHLVVHAKTKILDSRTANLVFV